MRLGDADASDPRMAGARVADAVPSVASALWEMKVISGAAAETLAAARNIASAVVCILTMIEAQLTE